MQRTLLLLMFGLGFQLLWGQAPLVEAEEMAFPATAVLSENFREYRVLRLDAAALHAAVEAQGATQAQLRLKLGADKARLLLLEKQNLLAPDYQRRAATERGIQTLPAREPGAYRGRLAGPEGRKLSLMIEPDFVFGLWTEGAEVWFIEPLYRLEPSAGKDLYLVYKERDMIGRSDFCGLALTHRKAEELAAKPMGPEKVGNCLIAEVALAADNSMRVAFGSVAGAESFMFGVLNNVQTNYDNEFADEIQLQVVATFVSTCSGCDPWTGSTNSGALLDDFAGWGNGGGFGTTEFDVASLWTNRDFAGSVIGLAWLGGTCTQERYNVLQNFSSNAAFLRVLQAHEFGHNFGATHDAEGSNTIMAPSVNSATAWSTNSRNEINAFIAANDEPVGCLAYCAPPAPPMADIVTPILEVCPGSYVPFFDNSTGNPVLWSWSFPGGDPASSTEQHPVVFYASPGVYSATLVVQNAADTDATTLNTDIVVGDAGRKYLMYENFEETTTWTISNPDNGIGWTFTGTDGNNGNRAMYVNNFDYNGGNGQVDALVSPVLNFTAEQDLLLELEYAYRRYNASLSDRLLVKLSTNGGATYPITLFSGQENGSGNFATGSDLQTAFFPSQPGDWCFQGPACIALDLSNYAGFPNVRIRIENVSGFGNNMFVDNIRLSSACQPLLPPEPAFIANNTSGCAPLTVTFSDQSLGANSVEWYFPGGNPDFSTSSNPTVTYSTPGVYDVTLVAINDAGSVSLNETAYITVGGPPTPAFTYTHTGLAYNFNNQTPNAVVFQWNFGDGGQSSLSDPAHTYGQSGTYVVRLTASNECGNASTQQTITASSGLEASFTASPLSGCPGQQVQYTDASMGNPTNWSWLFPGGSPAASSQQNPLVTYPQPGLYSATLVVTNGSVTDTFTRMQYVAIADTVVAAFGVSLPLDSTRAVFTNTTTGGATFYHWTFGDGDTSVVANPIHEYAMAGTYTVTLIAGNACFSDTISQTISVILTPVAGIIADTLSGCAPLTVTYAAIPQGPGYTYRWTFPGGQPDTSALANPTVAYSLPGHYGATLMVTNAAGSDTLTIDSIVAVSGPPEAGFVLDYSPGSLTASFAGASTGADSLSWFFGDGAGASGDSLMHTYAQAGTYTVTLIAVNACGADTATQLLTILLPPAAAIGSDVSSGCAPLTVHYTAAPQGEGLSYAWSFPGGQPASATEANPSVIYSQPGQYTATLIATNAAGSDTATAGVSVLGAPEAGFVLDYSPGSLTASFAGASTGADSLSWFFGDGAGASGDSLMHTYAQAGTYTVTLIAVNACGTDTATQLLTILLPPAAAIGSDVSSGCAPLTVHYTAAPQGEGLSYAWSFPGGQPASATEANPSVTYSQPGQYTATLIATNAAGSDTAAVSVSVQGLPSADFTVAMTPGSGFTTFANASTGATSLSWTFGDGAGSAEDSPTHTYGADGAYTVTLIAANACGADTATQVLTILLPPVAAFGMDPASGCAPLVVSYTATTQGEGLSYAWTFPGGQPASSAEANPVVTYHQPGQYGLTLIVSNAVGADTLTMPGAITALGPPAAVFSHTTNGSTAQFANTSSGAQVYFWDFGDGQNSGEAEPSHTFPGVGDYVVTLIAANDCGSDTTTTTVSINGNAPIVAFTATNNQGCAPLTVQFSNQSVGAATFSWSFPGGEPASSTEENPTVVYNTPGTYDVILTAGNAFGNSALNKVGLVVVAAGPTAGFTAAVDVATTSFANTSANANAYSWSFGDGDGSTEASPTHTYAAGGSYEVVLIATNTCGSDTLVQQVVIAGQAPVANFSASTTQGCAPLTVQFTDLSAGAPTGWQWSFPGGEPAASTEQNPTVVYNSPGSFAPPVLVAANAFGSSEATGAAITADAPPTGITADVEAVNPDQWDNLEFTLTAQVTGNAAFVNWLIAGVDTLIGNPVTFAFPGEGNFEITVIAGNSCGEISTTIEHGILFPAAHEPAWAKAIQVFPNPGYGHFVLSAQGWEGGGALPIAVYDLLGRRIQSASLPVAPGQWQHGIDLTALPSGVYLLRIEWKGQPWAIRLLKL